MARLPVTLEIAGLKVRCTPMTLPQSEEMLPEVIELVGIGLRDLAKDGKVNLENVTLEELGSALIHAGSFLGGGRLARLAPRIFATCAVAVADVAGVFEWHQMSKESERALVLDAHPAAYFPILLFAGRQSFGRFFPSGLFVASPGGPAPGAAGQPAEPTPTA